MIKEKTLISKINTSPSFSETEKKRLIEIIPSLSNEKKKQLFWVLLEEKQKLNLIHKKYLAAVDQSFDILRINTKETLTKTDTGKHKQKTKLWNFFKGLNRLERALKGN